MNKSNLAQIIADSQLSESAKERIISLIDGADDQAVKKEILQIIDTDIVMAQSVADELNEIATAMKIAEKQLDVVDAAENEEVSRLETVYSTNDNG